MSSPHLLAVGQASAFRLPSLADVELELELSVGEVEFVDEGVVVDDAAESVASER